MAILTENAALTGLAPMIRLLWAAAASMSGAFADHGTGVPRAGEASAEALGAADDECNAGSVPIRALRSSPAARQ